jgi:hypothetical protein
MPDPRTAAEYRRRAAKFRGRAIRAKLPFLQKNYLKLAASYELRADQVEVAERTSVPNREDDGSTG